MTQVAIALGSNLGERERLLAEAVAAIGEVVSGIRVSSFIRTAPVGVGPQPDFLNGALTGDTSLAPRGLLARMLAIEAALGRARPYPGAPRTLDLDLILYGPLVIDEPGLIVPHPRFRERQFVLEPLAEIAPDWVDPVTGRTVRELFEALPRDADARGGAERRT